VSQRRRDPFDEFYSLLEPTLSPQRRESATVLKFIAVIAALVSIVAVLVVSHRPKPFQSVRLVVALSMTAQEAGLTKAPEDVLTAAKTAAAHGGGTLVLLSSSSYPGQQVGEPVDLRVLTDGEPEHDARTRDDIIVRRVNKAFTALLASPPTQPGRSFTAQLSGVSAALRSEAINIVYLYSIGLSTTQPDDARRLMAAEAGQAAAAVPAAAVPSLAGAEVHATLTAAAGNQPPLSGPSLKWRDSYVEALLIRTGAASIDVHDDNTARPPIEGAPQAPVVRNIELPTPGLPSVPLHPKPDTTVIDLDTSASFQPNVAILNMTPAQLTSALTPILVAWRESGKTLRVRVTGHCAAWGPREGAVRLSQQRAQVITDELRKRGVQVADSDVTGKGYDDPPDPLHPQAATNRVVEIEAASRTLK
jgi:outer membrane protein OmpA-like peptidoglycan-associated protein